jgi:hypothetical protein
MEMSITIKSRLLYSQEKSSRYSLERRPFGFPSRMETVLQKQISALAENRNAVISS